MATTVYAYYEGWEIEIRYVKERQGFLGSRRAARFTATGVARPHKKTNLLEWTDTGPQTVTTRDRIFHCGEEAFKQLMFEMQRLIDSLRRQSVDCSEVGVAC